MLQDFSELMVDQVREVFTKVTNEHLFEAQYCYWSSIKSIMLNSQNGYSQVRIHYPHVTLKMATCVANASNDQIKALCNSTLSLLQPSVTEDVIESLLLEESPKAMLELQSKAMLQTLAQQPVNSDATDMVHAIGGGGV